MLHYNEWGEKCKGLTTKTKGRASLQIFTCFPACGVLYVLQVVPAFCRRTNGDGADPVCLADGSFVSAESVLQQKLQNTAKSAYIYAETP